MTSPNNPPPPAFTPYSDGDLYPPALHEIDEDPFHNDGTYVFEHPVTDHWTHAKLNLTQG